MYLKRTQYINTLNERNVFNENAAIFFSDLCEVGYIWLAALALRVTANRTIRVAACSKHKERKSFFTIKLLGGRSYGAKRYQSE